MMQHRIRFLDALSGLASADNMDYNIVADKGFVDMDPAVAASVGMGSALVEFADKNSAVALSVGKDSAAVEFAHMDSVDCYPDSMDFAATGFVRCSCYCHLIHFRHNSSQNLRIFIIIIIVYETIRVNICKKIKKKDAYASLVFEI